MTLLCFDGFDNRATADLALRYTNNNVDIDTSNQRTGHGCLLMNGNGDSLNYAFTSAEDTFVFGVALNYYDTGNTGYFWRLRLGGTDQCRLDIATDGYLSVVSAFGTATTSKKLTVGQYMYVELKYLIHNSAGTYELRVNNNVWLSGSGVDTQQAASATADNWLFSNNQNSKGYYMDDMYFLDDAGAGPDNDFLGDLVVETLLPSGAGNAANWTPSAGANYENVDDTVPDADTTYNLAGSALADSYALGNLATASGTVYGVQIASMTKKSDAGAVTLRNTVRQGTTDYPQATFGPGTDYGEETNLLLTDPDTASAWTVSGVNSLEVGIERTA